MTLAILITTLAFLLALAMRGDDRVRTEYYRRRLTETLEKYPPATVIVPVKGEEEGLAANLASLAALDYPDYELIVVAAAKSDVPGDAVPTKARLVVAGEGDPKTGAKINNLLAAVKAARSQSQVFAFADSDGLVPAGWLKALVTPLGEPNVGVVTGYRFHTPPAPAGMASLFRSVWNGVVAGGMHHKDNSFCWGGAMAVTKQNFKKLKVEERWRGAVSDDYRLAQTVHNAGLTITFAPGALTADTSHTNWGRLLEWTTRQLVITRVYSPKLWWMGFAAHILYCAAWPAAAFAAVDGVAWGPLALAGQLYLGMKKGFHRTQLIRAAMPRDDAWFRRYGWAHWALVPFVTWVWLYSFLTSAMTTTIEWRGRRYDLRP
ncbi:MAG: glycosyltransferase [Bryobacterales bacterium]|nr:glycosyltransferase [Bryobacterales bacterium]